MFSHPSGFAPPEIGMQPNFSTLFNFDATS